MFNGIIGLQGPATIDDYDNFTPEDIIKSMVDVSFPQSQIVVSRLSLCPESLTPA